MKRTYLFCSVALLMFAICSSSSQAKDQAPVQVISDEDHQGIHLALTSWESEEFGFEFASRGNKKSFEKGFSYLKNFLIMGLGSFAFSNGRFDIYASQFVFYEYEKFRILYGLLFTLLSAKIISDSFDFFQGLTTSYLFSESKELAVANFLLKRADQLCFRYGYRQMDLTSFESLMQMELIHPIYLEPQDFDKFKIYLDGTRIHKNTASDFSVQMKDPTKMNHFRFHRLYCK